jgi:AsmA protein
MPSRGNRPFRLVLLAAVAIVLGVGVWIKLGAGINAERLKASLQQAVQRATGRGFTIDGPVHVTLGLSPRLTAENIRLANLPGGSRPDMLTARSLQAQVALLPLLEGEVVVLAVTLEAPDILLENGSDGIPNWQFHAARTPLYRDPDASPAAHTGGGQVQINRIRLNGGHIAISAPNLPAIAADLVGAEIKAESGSSPLHGQISGQAGQVPFSVTINAGSFDRLQGGPVMALSGAWPLTVQLQAAGASLKLDGGVNHPDEFRGYAFLVTGNAPDMTPLASWLPKPLALPWKDVNFTVRLTDGNNGVLRTSGLSLHAGEADLTAGVPGLILKEAVFSAPGPGQQAELNVDGVFQGAPLRIAGSTTQPDTLATTVPIPVAISAQVASATLSARGTVPPGLTGNGFDLTLDVRAPSLAELTPLAGRALPDIRDIVFGAHLGDAGFRLRGLHLRELSADSSLGDVSGDVTIAWSPVPTLSGTLAAKHFDIDAARAAFDMITAAAEPPAPPAPAPVAPPAAATPAAPPAEPAPAEPTPQRLIPDTKLPFAALHGADANLTLSADRVKLDGETYSDLQAHLLANDGKLILNPLRLTSPQGAIIGAFTLDEGVDPPSVAVTLRSPSLSASRVAALLGETGGATGTVQVDAQLNGTGDTPRALAASLTGHLGVTMVNGTITDTMVQALFANALGTAGVPMGDGSSDVRCFALRADFYHGAGRVRALSLDTSRMSVDGDGVLDLGAETLALHLRPIVRIGGTGVAAPVSVSGAFSELKPALDPMPNGRVGITIGGPRPNDDSCVAQLALARGGMPGPMPSLAGPEPGTRKKKKPIDLLQGLFH